MGNDILVMSQSNLRNLFSDVLDEKIDSLSKSIESKLLEKDKPLQRDDAMQYLGMSSPTFYRYIKSGHIKQYGSSNRTYYKKSQLEEFALGKQLN